LASENSASLSSKIHAFSPSSHLGNAPFCVYHRKSTGFFPPFPYFLSRISVLFDHVGKNLTTPFPSAPIFPHPPTHSPRFCVPQQVFADLKLPFRSESSLHPPDLLNILFISLKLFSPQRPGIRRENLAPADFTFPLSIW